MSEPGPATPDPDGSQAPAPAPPDPGARAGERGPGLVAQVRRAGRGVLAAAGSDPGWAGYFDLSTTGFLRSFYGPALALPLYVFGEALVTRGLMNGRPIPSPLLWGAGAAHILDAVGFPLLIALIARPLRIGAGYAAFVIVTNWAALFLNAFTAMAALLALAGQDGLEAFSLFTLILLCAWVFLIWRAGRLTLSSEIAPVLLVVVLRVAVSAGADQLVQQFAGAAGG